MVQGAPMNKTAPSGLFMARAIDLPNIGSKFPFAAWVIGELIIMYEAAGMHCPKSKQDVADENKFL